MVTTDKFGSTTRHQTLQTMVFLTLTLLARASRLQLFNKSQSRPFAVPGLEIHLQVFEVPSEKRVQLEAFPLCCPSDTFRTDL